MISTNLPPLDHKVEMPIKLCEEENAILGPIFPVIISFHIEIVKQMFWNMNISMLLRFNMWEACMERKETLYNTDYICKFSSTIIQINVTTLPDKQKAILYSISRPT